MPVEVIRKADGERVWIERFEFDPARYDRLDVEADPGEDPYDPEVVAFPLEANLTAEELDDAFLAPQVRQLAELHRVDVPAGATKAQVIEAILDYIAADSGEDAG